MHDRNVEYSLLIFIVTGEILKIILSLTWLQFDNFL